MVIEIGLWYEKGWKNCKTDAFNVKFISSLSRFVLGQNEKNETLSYHAIQSGRESHYCELPIFGVIQKLRLHEVHEIPTLINRFSKS